MLGALTWQPRGTSVHFSFCFQTLPSLQARSVHHAASFLPLIESAWLLLPKPFIFHDCFPPSFHFNEKLPIIEPEIT